MFKRFVLLVLTLALFLSPLTVEAAQFNRERATAYMDIRFECGCHRGGTGAMVGRRCLLTAGHNLYCHTHGKPLKTCDFRFGPTSTSKCYYQYKGKFQFWVYDTFQYGYNSQNDIGYVIFESNVGDKTGWFATQVPSAYLIENNAFFFHAYSSKLKLNRLGELPYMVDNIGLEIWIPNHIDGYSGGPVTLAVEDNEIPPVVGVYTSTAGDNKTYARLLTQDVFMDMKENGAFK